MELFTVAFFGHRRIEDLLHTEERLENYVRTLLREKEYVEFLVGNNGAFDQCVASVIKRLQKNYRGDNSTMTLFLPYYTAEYAHNREEMEGYYSNVEISFEAASAHPKRAIKIRNYEMAERCDLILCYVSQNKGGAFQAVSHGKKYGKPIFNLGTYIF